MKNVFIKLVIPALLVLFIQNTEILCQTDEYPDGQAISVLGPISQGQYAAALIPPSISYTWLSSGYFSVWVYLTSHNPNTAYVMQRGDSLYLGISDAQSGHVPIFRFGSVYAEGKNAVPLNKWVHLTCSWFRDEGDVSTTIYIDGYPLAFGHAVTDNPSITDSITIGGSRLIANSSIIGYIDEAVCEINFPDHKNRFISLGGENANLDSALSSGDAYLYYLSWWSFRPGEIGYDDLNGNHAYYRGGLSSSYVHNNFRTMPYNKVLQIQGKGVRVDHDPLFNRTSSGTIDCWIYRDSFTTIQTPVILNKGNTEVSSSYSFFLTPQGELSLRIGTGQVTGTRVPNREWTHTAVTWKNEGASYSVKLYVNGKLRNESSINNSMPLNSDTLWIGCAPWDIFRVFSGYIDELRIWKKDLTADEIKNNMFVSSRTESPFQQQHLGIGWGFDGSLLPNGQNIFTNIAPGSSTYLRFSAYLNERYAGDPDTLTSFSTAINRNLTGGVFPNEFLINAPDKNVPAGQVIKDTINISSNNSLNNIEVFLSYKHITMGQNVITLTAPNGQTRNILSNNGGKGNDVLTFFADGNTPLSNFFPPWSNNAAPSQSFGNFGGTGIQGNWILTVTNSGGTSGKLLGWGIRTNSSTIGIEPVSNNIPGNFRLYQNYPNPFNPATDIRFDLPKDEFVRIAVYDITGKEVSLLVNEFKQAGEYKVSFDAGKLATGVYFYRIESVSFNYVRKMLLVK